MRRAAQLHTERSLFSAADGPLAAADDDAAGGAAPPAGGGAAGALPDARQVLMASLLQLLLVQLGMLRPLGILRSA